MESSTEKKHCHALLAFVGKTSWQQIKRIESQRVHQSQIHSIEILFSFILLSSIVYFLFCLTMQLLFGVIVVLFISATVVQSLRTTTATNKIVSSVDKLLLHSQIDKNEPVVRSVTALLHSNSDSNSHNCRKKKLGKTIGTIVTSLLLLTNSAPAFAAVGEGDLPEGVLAFRKVLKYQDDWKKLSVTISERKNELSNKELLGIKGFLKQLANEYSDMELLMRGITDPQKAADAKTIAKDFRKKIRECDDAVGDGNLDKVIELYPTTAKQLTDFLLLLQDVPDEL